MKELNLLAQSSLFSGIDPNDIQKILECLSATHREYDKDEMVVCEGDPVDDWMNNSMICYIERDVFASVEDENFLKRFQGFKNRKINLPREGTRCVLF